MTRMPPMGVPTLLLIGVTYDDQLRHYKAKLEYEIDPWDLNEALGRGDKILLVEHHPRKRTGEAIFAAR